MFVWLVWAIRLGWRLAAGGRPRKTIELARAHGRAYTEWERHKLVERGDAPPAPEGLAQLLWFDCRPLSPSAWAAEWADHWYDAWDVQVAYRQAIAEVKAEAKTTDTRAAIAAAFDEEDD